MEYENTIIMKEMRNSINRQNNCDVANLNKTVSAAQSVISDIKQLMGTAEYETENGKFSLSADDMIFIPCGCKLKRAWRNAYTAAWKVGSQSQT